MCLSISACLHYRLSIRMTPSSRSEDPKVIASVPSVQLTCIDQQTGSSC